LGPHILEVSHGGEGVAAAVTLRHVLKLAGNVLWLDAGEERDNITAAAVADASNQSHEVRTKLNVGDL